MPRREPSPNHDTLEMSARVNDWLDRQPRGTRARLARKLGMKPYEFTRRLYPKRYGYGSWLASWVKSLSEATGLSADWIMTGRAPDAVKAAPVQYAFDPASAYADDVKSAAELLELIRRHDRNAADGSAIYQTMPMRVVRPELLAVIRRNLFIQFPHAAGRLDREFGELSEAARREHDSFRPAEMPRRETFLSLEAMFRLIHGDEEFEGRTPQMAKQFLMELRTVHVIDRGFRLFFFKKADLPFELRRRFTVLGGITVIGRTLALHRSKDFRIGIIEDPALIEEDRALVEQLRERLGTRATLRATVQTIRRLEGELALSCQDHPQQGDKKKGFTLSESRQQKPG